MSSNGNLRSFDVHGKRVRFAADGFAGDWLAAACAPGTLYEPKVAALLVDLLTPESVFVDVGAWIGWYSCIAGQFCKEVHAFEMNDTAYRELRLNGDLNLPTAGHMVANHMAVWDTASVVRYKAQKRPAIGVDPEGGATARAVTLDGYFANRDCLPDVVKIDVEGGEAKVLAGMTEILDAGVNLIMEVHRDKIEGYGSGSAEAMLNGLAARGYEVRYVDNGAEVDTCCLPRNFKIYARPA